MIEPTQLDLQRAREVTHLYGGNGLSTTQSERLVAEKLAEWRFDAAAVVKVAEDAIAALHYRVWEPEYMLSHDTDAADDVANNTVAPFRSALAVARLTPA